MIKIIVHAYVQADKEKAVVEVVFASADEQAVYDKLAELTKQFPNDYLAIYDLPQDTDLNQLDTLSLCGDWERGFLGGKLKWRHY